MTNASPRLAYIEEVFMGANRPKRFTASFDGILFPGYSDRFTATWATRAGARGAAVRAGYTVVKGSNPKPRPPQSVLEAYSADCAARQAKEHFRKYGIDSALSFGEGTKADPDRCVKSGALFLRDAAEPFDVGDVLVDGLWINGRDAARDGLI